MASGQTTTFIDTFFSHRALFTAVANTSSEASLIAGLNEQPWFRPGFFDGFAAFGKGIRLTARGLISCTSTPTITFTARLGTTLGASYLSGTTVGVSPAITLQSGITSQIWKLSLDLFCFTPGLGTGNCILSGAGEVMSPGGFAAPYIYGFEPTAPGTGTWTATIDGSLTQYLNLTATWSAMSSSNTLICKQLYVESLN